MPKSQRKSTGQSFVELAIVLPLLLFLLIGFVEVGAIIYSYLSMLDVAREAARFASEHDPDILEGPGAGGFCEDDELHFFQDTACVIVGAGFNPDIVLDPTRDDVTISVFTIKLSHFFIFFMSSIVIRQSVFNSYCIITN